LRKFIEFGAMPTYDAPQLCHALKNKRRSDQAELCGFRQDTYDVYLPEDIHAYSAWVCRADFEKHAE
jgi:hypothetical protein